MLSLFLYKKEILKKLKIKTIKPYPLIEKTQKFNQNVTISLTIDTVRVAKT